jgi:oligopeptidase B
MTSKARLARPRSAAPAARRLEAGKTWHGTFLSDPYAWLRAENWREALADSEKLPAEVSDHLKAENAYAASAMKPLAALRRTLVAEMRGRIEDEETFSPIKDGPFAYQWRYRKGAEHPEVLRRPREGGAETILVDGAKEAAGQDYFSLGAVIRSPDHQLALWSRDIEGAEHYTIILRDLASGRDLDRVTDTAGGAVWFGDGGGFLYIRMDENQRPSSLHYHRLGTPQGEDVLVHREDDPAYSLSIEETLDERFCILSTSDMTCSEVRLIDLRQRIAPGAGPIIGAPIRAREEDIRISVDVRFDRLFVQTNLGGTKDFRILEGPLDAPLSLETFSDVVPHRPGVLIEDFGVTSGHLIRLETVNALPRIIMRDLATGMEQSIDFPDAAYDVSFDLGAEFDTRTISYRYESPIRPPEEYSYDLDSGERKLIRRTVIPSGHEPERYRVERIEAVAPDGALVPVTVLSLKDTPRDSSAPAYLYGYGSYGFSTEAGFVSDFLSLADRGFFVATAHIRGGMERGFAWYEAGKRRDKQNSFSDFIAAARHLIAQNYTKADRIVAEGRSAGGLLMGAVVNQAPELFAGIIANVPFVDVMNTMLDAALPLTPGEWKEWGNPIDSAEEFGAMRGYSPYDNIRPVDYPPILALASTGDPRVGYWEPAKWIARLRAEATGGPFLLKTNLKAGHFGAAGRYESLDETALTTAFALAVTG